ncbi:MAG: DSD1 family PLP-dependent enzyme [Phenylobacterium sp.]|uniref:DSD1 family PLP-dependent enzyme n=1 Tax=Phenylobacterium sp. TaxID=1871053 RepID=UPI00391B5006
MTYAQTLHQHLIGRQGSRRDLNTPALLVDLDALERNIAAMADRARQAGLALRPHAKTHKCAAIARRQIEAGALGVCCAKLGEAEALADAGIGGLLITSPVVGASAVARLAALAARSEGLMASVDHPAAVDAIAASGARMTVLVDIDPGLHRTGVADAEAAVALARRIEAAPGLTFGGVQFYCGSQQHIEAFAERRAAIIERTDYLKSVIARLSAAGLAPKIVSGGGTGTHAIDLELGVFTELQVGSYVFMDRQYEECDLTGDGRVPFETSLMLDARVISANHDRLVTVDAGFKAFATEAGAPPILAGAPAGSAYHFMGDEHGCIVPPRGERPPELGEVVTLAAPHCDPTVNLHDAYHVIQGDTLVDIWPLEARGRSA